jgi:threonine synthase
VGRPARLACPRCREAGDLAAPPVVCARCGTVMEIEIDLGFARPGLAERIRRRPRGLWRWHEFLPVDASRGITLGEGDTPLLHAPRLARELGLERLHVKNDTVLPTGSLKDRSVTVALTHARTLGAGAVGVASSGNHAASVAAYAAAAGLPAIVMVPAATSPAKVLQARAHGATLLAVRAGFDATFALFKEALKAFGWYSCLSTNPWRNEGKKSYAFETWEDLRGETPDWMLHPIGGGLGVTACWKGWRELVALGWASRVPRMVAAQPAAADPITRAFEAGADDVASIPIVADTVAQAIAVGAPSLGWRCLDAVRRTGGAAASATDAELLEAQALLAHTAGIYCEPSAAASVAVARRLRREGRIKATDLVVCVVTGHGLKQPGPVEPAPMHTVDPTLAAVEAALSKGDPTWR